MNQIPPSLPLAVSPDGSPATAAAMFGGAALDVADPGTPYRAPRDAAEAMLCRLFADLTGAGRVGIDDGFFTLGGDSIGATRLVRRAREAGLGFAVRDVFAQPCVAGLASIGTRMAPAPSPDAWPTPVQPAPMDPGLRARLVEAAPHAEDILPLTPLQQGLAFESLTRIQAGREDPYHLQIRIDLVGPLDTVRLRGAWLQLIGRHAALRLAVVLAALEQGLALLLPPQLDWRDHGEREGGLPALLAADRAERFDLAGGTLLRLHLLRVAPDRHHVLLACHHLVLDGWSIPVLLGEVAALYRGEALPPAPPWQAHL
ncbi:MAG: condensation domain-containing protein, partial [Paracraurococcus sp.]